MLRNKGQRTTEAVSGSKHCPLMLCRFMPAEALTPYVTGTRKTLRALQGSQHGKGAKHWTAGLWVERSILLWLRAPSCTTGGITLLSAHLLPSSFNEVPQGIPHHKAQVAV